MLTISWKRLDPGSPPETALGRSKRNELKLRSGKEKHCNPQGHSRNAADDTIVINSDANGLCMYVCRTHVDVGYTDYQGKV